MAYEIPGLRFSLEAGEKIPRRRFVSIDKNEKAVVATAETVVIGASAVDSQKEGEVMEIYDGIVIVETGEALTAGTEVGSDVEGKAIAVAVGGTAVGICLTNAKEGGYTAVKLG